MTVLLGAFALAGCGEDAAEDNVGAACRVNADCASNVCLPTGVDRRCTNRCSSDETCPMGWSCDVFAGISGTVCQCESEPEVPNDVDDDCDGIVDETGTSDVCGDGSCTGAENASSCPGDCTGGDGGRPPPGAISARLTQFGAAASGLTVLVHGLDGSVVMSLTSGADGAVTIPADTEASMVTAVFPPNAAGTYRMLTYAGVQPDDILGFVGPGDPGPNGVVGSSSTTLPGPFAGADSYDVTNSCFGVLTTDTSVPVALDLQPSCARDNQFNVLAIAVDTARNPVAYSLVANVPVSPGMAAAATLPAWNSVLGNNDFQLNNPPPGAGAALVQSRVRMGGSALGFIKVADNLVFVDGAPQSSAWGMPTIPGYDSLESSVRLNFGPDTGPESTIFYYRRAAAPAPVVLDLSSDVLPKVHTAGGTAGVRPTITWISDGALTNASFGRHFVQWGVGADIHQWLVMLPPDTPSGFQYPELPAELSARHPPSGGLTVEILFGRCDSAADYPSVRRRNCPVIGHARTSSESYEMSYVVTRGGA